MIAVVGGATAIFQQQTFEAAIIGFTHGGMDADIGGDAAQDQVADAAQVQHELQIRGAE